MERVYSLVDRCIMHVELALTTLVVQPESHVRSNPADTIEVPDKLSLDEQKHAAGLMRVNHVGEVCAQALYQGQAIVATSSYVAEQMQQAADEEFDHLAWCMARLRALDSHASFLNPFWYVGSLLIGMTAGLCGDKWSLSFLAETENQVVKHLESHLSKLPASDEKSRAIVTQMMIDEGHHRDQALDTGGVPLPAAVSRMMKAMSKVMTSVAYFI